MTTTDHDPQIFLKLLGLRLHEEGIVTEQRIEPHRVTKPIQLLAVWLVGLVATNTSFLAAATQFGADGWERGALVIAAILNVPIFLAALFILQTRFRAELQEDTYYAEYLSKKTAEVFRLDKHAAQDAKIEEIERRISLGMLEGQGLSGANIADSSILEWDNWPVGLNQRHPRFSEVREALRSARIPLSEIFGAASEDAPPRWIVAISNELPVGHKVHLLRTVLPYGFDGIQFWDPIREVGENEDVYIGSFGVTTYAQITSEFARLLERNVEAVDLNHYYAHHQVGGEATKKTVPGRRRAAPNE